MVDQSSDEPKLLVYKLLLGPMVRHYALLYGFHTLPNMLTKPLREARGFVYVYKCLTYDLSGDLCEMEEALTLVALKEIPREVIG